jgi:2-hydroxychromene-2-carboxylate isomerase
MRTDMSKNLRPNTSGAPLEFWFDFASPYSYIAAMRIEALCWEGGVRFTWRPFLLGPIFALQGWCTSHFNLNERRGNYMWRDMERLTAKYRLPWRRPSVFPRNAVLAARVASAFQDAAWISVFIPSAFVANFRDDGDLNDESVIGPLLDACGADKDFVLDASLNSERREYLRRNTREAIALGIFGAPNCVVGGELFWGEEALEDAVDWARRTEKLTRSISCEK